jgi:hypothetical protein
MRGAVSAYPASSGTVDPLTSGPGQPGASQPAGASVVHISRHTRHEPSSPRR